MMQLLRHAKHYTKPYRTLSYKGSYCSSGCNLRVADEVIAENTHKHIRFPVEALKGLIDYCGYCGYCSYCGYCGHCGYYGYCIECDRRQNATHDHATPHHQNPIQTHKKDGARWTISRVSFKAAGALWN